MGTICPRCNTGRFITRWFTAYDKETSCMTCGYEAIDIPADVLDEVAQSLGKSKLHQLKPTSSHYAKHQQ